MRTLSNLGQSISLARRRRHLSQQDLAERIGASANTVRRMEAGSTGTALVHFARAMQVFGELDKLAEKLNATIIPADATSEEDLENLFVKSQEILGGKLDFVLHSIVCP